MGLGVCQVIIAAISLCIVSECAVSGQLPSLFFPHQPWGEEGAPDIEGVTLDGIVFISPDQWSAWLNGQKVTPELPHKDVEILEVAHTHVRLRMRGGKLELVLRPGGRVYPKREPQGGGTK